MKSFVFIVLSLVFPLISFGEIDIQKVVEKKVLNDMIEMKLKYRGDLGKYPKLKYHQKKVELRVPNANFPHSLVNDLEYNNGVSIEKKADEIILWVNTGLPRKTNAAKTSVRLGGNSLSLTYPWQERRDQRVEDVVNKAKEQISPKVTDTKEDDILTVLKEDNGKNSRLKELIDEFESEKNLSQEILWASNSDKMIGNELKKDNKAKQTIVGNSFEATQETDSGKLAVYVTKIVGVLAAIIFFFLVVVNIFRKKVMNKNKLGFLHNSKLVEVVNTTYVSPKKTLLLVRAHEQFILLANTESGIEFLTEINDAVGLLKQGEKEIMGSNFDGNLAVTNKAEDLDQRVKVKEASRIYESRAVNDSPVKNFSQKLKNKARKMKQVNQQV